MREQIMGRFVGARVRRVEDRRLLSGRGRYVDDVVVPDMAHAAFVRSPWPHALIRGIDLTRAAATLTGAPRLVKATTASIRRTLISVPARIASSARRLTLHLPTDWPWETAWNMLFDSVFHRHIPIIG